MDAATLVEQLTLVNFDSHSLIFGIRLTDSLTGTIPEISKDYKITSRSIVTASILEEITTEIQNDLDLLRNFQNYTHYYVYINEIQLDSSENKSIIKYAKVAKKA